MLPKGIHALHDVHTLAAPKWYWPLGLYSEITLIILVLAGLWWLISWRYQQHPLRKLRRRALKELSFLQQNKPSQPTPTVSWLNTYNQLLKRFARACFPDQDIANLHDLAWMHFLIKHSQSGCWEGLESVLVQGMYQKQVTYDANRLLISAKTWMIERTR
jgi:hypothetical protein